MGDDSTQCSCLVDCSGLHEIANMSANLKGEFLDHFLKGELGVAACAWQEFHEIYEEEAAALAPYVTVKFPLKRAYHVGAASIADKIGLGFPRGGYDTNTDLFTATIAKAKNISVLTSITQLEKYEKMECEVFDFQSWVDIT
jgi:hypothetical protein